MRILIQKVSEASVSIENQPTASIKRGLLVFVGIETQDNEEDIHWLSSKIVQMRLFEDDAGVMNLSLKDIDGEILLVSQFTLQANVKKGNRPSYIKAAPPKIALPLYENMALQLKKDLGKVIATGTFGADMQINLINDGPVTIWVDSKNRQ